MKKNIWIYIYTLYPMLWSFTTSGQRFTLANVNLWSFLLVFPPRIPRNGCCETLWEDCSLVGSPKRTTHQNLHPLNLVGPADHAVISDHQARHQTEGNLPSDSGRGSSRAGRVEQRNNRHNKCRRALQAWQLPSQGRRRWCQRRHSLRTFCTCSYIGIGQGTTCQRGAGWGHLTWPRRDWPLSHLGLRAEEGRTDPIRLSCPLALLKHDVKHGNNWIV